MQRSAVLCCVVLDGCHTVLVMVALLQLLRTLTKHSGRPCQAALPGKLWKCTLGVFNNLSLSTDPPSPPAPHFMQCVQSGAACHSQFCRAMPQQHNAGRQSRLYSLQSVICDARYPQETSQYQPHKSSIHIHPYSDISNVADLTAAQPQTTAKASARPRSKHCCTSALRIDRPVFTNN